MTWTMYLPLILTGFGTMWMAKRRRGAPLVATPPATGTEVPTSRRARMGEAAAGDELKDRFLSTVSHELRTPLNAIIGWAQIIKSGALKPAEVNRAIEAIDRNARVQARLVNELLDISRMMQGRLTVTRAPADLKQILADVLAAMRPGFDEKGVALREGFEVEDIRVLGDEARLRQVVETVVGNALKFTPASGRVEVTVGVDRAFAVVCVRDSGVGVAPEMLPHLFEPFYQAQVLGTRRSGLGLGLALAKEIVDLHAGTIRVDSGGVGRGTQVTIKVPLTRAPLARRPEG